MLLMPIANPTLQLISKDRKSHAERVAAAASFRSSGRMVNAYSLLEKNAHAATEAGCTANCLQATHQRRHQRGTHAPRLTRRAKQHYNGRQRRRRSSSRRRQKRRCQPQLEWQRLKTGLGVTRARSYWKFRPTKQNGRPTYRHYNREQTACWHRRCNHRTSLRRVK
jgi:hypothetical protein